MALYKELRQTLAAEIAQGAYPVGEKFPTEHELCARFAVSRHTVREALRTLEEQGLLARQAGAGTTVLARATPSVFIHTLDSLAGLHDYALETRFEKRHEGFLTARAALAETLGCTPGERWLRFAGLRRDRDDRAICWTEIFVAEAFSAVRDDEARDGALYERIARRFDIAIARVEQRIGALAMPAQIAEVLGVEAGSPALLTRRRYWADQGQPFEISLSFHPGARYAYTQMLERDHGGRRP